MISTPLKAARSALAAEWAAAAPSSPAEIAAFYRDAHGLAADLDAFHAEPSRQGFTTLIVKLAEQIHAASVVDIGAGGGHDLSALRDAGIPGLSAVEPNLDLGERLIAHGFETCLDVADAPVEYADMVLCMDVLEHLPDPDAFLASIAKRMRAGGKQPGAILVEATSTHDTATPLHIADNRGWHPGRVLEHHGFQLLEAVGNLRIWQRSRATRQDFAWSLILCAYRALSMPTFQCVEKLRTFQRTDTSFRILPKTGDGLISRARSMIATRWLLETDDDVFLMVDDDITFLPEVAEQVVAKVRNGLDIVAAAYPVRSGAHLAIHGLPGAEDSIGFGPEEPPQEIRWAGTGFFAVHRHVLEVMARTLPYCHEDQPWGFFPFFMPMIVEMPTATVYASEDWAFCERARALGFKVWLDPAARIGHLATLELNVANADAVRTAVGSGFEGPE